MIQEISRFVLQIIVDAWWIIPIAFVLGIILRRYSLRVEQSNDKKIIQRQRPKRRRNYRIEL
jgi:hypothetical protein